MRQLVATGRLLRATLHVLHGLWVVQRFPRLDAAGRQARVQWWAQGLLQSCGIRLDVQGVSPRPGATLVVANHISWMDIAAIHAAAPHARFVSKADVLAWPVLGGLIRGVGTLFIERERKRDALRVVHAMAEALTEGDTIAVFPEGTTGEGPELLPFHANLLQAAIATGTPVQAIVLRYADATGPFSPAAAYVGDTTLLQSIWRVVSARDLVAHVRILPPVATPHADRRALAVHLRELMAAELAVEAPAQASAAGSA